MKLPGIAALLFASCACNTGAFLTTTAPKICLKNHNRQILKMNYEPPSLEEVQKMKATEEADSTASSNTLEEPDRNEATEGMDSAGSPSFFEEPLKIEMTGVSDSAAPTSSIEETKEIEAAEVSKTPASATSSSIVPINEENLQFGAGILGGATGLILGGPLLALVLSIAANFSSKQENEIGEVTRGISKTAIESFNFLTSLNAKYMLTDKGFGVFNEAIGKLKETDDSKAIEKVEVTLKDTTSKASKFAEEYDLITKSKQVLGTVGELADSAISKTVELTKEYKVVDKVADSVKKAVDSTQSKA